MTQTAASTRNPDPLGDRAALRRRAQALAVLDLLLVETPEHQFGRAEGLFEGVELAGWDNGQGDDVMVVFSPAGTLVRGFDHESSMSPYDPDVATMHLSDDELEALSIGDEAALLEELRPFTGVLDPVPPPVRELLEQLDREPARPVAVPSVMTFCLWRPADADAWRVGPIEFPDGDDPDGSAYLLTHYSCEAAAYQAWLQERVGRAVPPELVAAVFAHHPLTPELVRLAEGPRGFEELSPLVAALGYGTDSPASARIPEERPT